MDLVLFVVLYTAAVGGCGYVFMAGEPDRPGIVNRLNRLITRDLIDAIRWALWKTLGERGVKAYDGFEEYICWSANPLLQLFYLAMILSGFVGFVLLALPFVPCQPGFPCWPPERPEGTCDFLAPWHRVTAYATMTTCLASWVACCWSEPGRVTPYSPLSVYCYAWDGFVHTRKICSTTRLLRPARSTYCRYTNGLVLRFDHFCPWIKNSVGENNYRYFLLFLTMHWFTLGYASWGCSWMLMTRLEDEKFWSRTEGLAHIYDPITGQPRPITWGETSRVLLMLENKVTLLAIFCFFLAVVIWFFWAYHIWLTATNMTTNESIKRGRVRGRILAAYETGDTAFLAEIEAANSAQVCASSEEDDTGPVAPNSIRKRPGAKGKKSKPKNAGRDSGAPQTPAFGTLKLPTELTCMERLEDVIMWLPMLVRGIAALLMGGIVGGYIGYAVLEWNFLWGGVVAVVASWVGVAIAVLLPYLLGWGRPHIHMPNPYDRGLLQNFGEVLFPRSVRANSAPVSGAPTAIVPVPLEPEPATADGPTAIPS